MVLLVFVRTCRPPHESLVDSFLLPVPFRFCNLALLVSCKQANTSGIVALFCTTSTFEVLQLVFVRCKQATTRGIAALFYSTSAFMIVLYGVFSLYVINCLFCLFLVCRSSWISYSSCSAFQYRDEKDCESVFFFL